MRKYFIKTKYSKIIKKSDPKHKEYCNIGKYYRPHGNIEVIGTEYYCINCNKTFTYDEQSLIIETQKYYRRKIVSKDEINNTKERRKDKSVNFYKKSRWFLLYVFANQSFIDSYGILFKIITGFAFNIPTL